MERIKVVTVLCCVVFVVLSGAVLWAVNPELNIRGVGLFWKVGRIVNHVEQKTLFMMMDHFGIKNITIFDTAPNKNAYFSLPCKHHCFNRNSKKTSLKRGLWSQGCGCSLVCGIKNRSNRIAYFRCLDLCPNTNICGWRQADIFQNRPKNIFFDSILVPGNMRSIGKTLTENKSTQMLFRQVFGSFDQSLGSTPKEGSVDRKAGRNYCEPDGGPRYPKIVPWLCISLICLIIGFGFALCAGSSFYYKRPVLRALLVGMGFLFGIGGFLMPIVLSSYLGK